MTICLALVLSAAGELMDGFIFAMITNFITQMFALRRPFFRAVYSFPH